MADIGGESKSDAVSNQDQLVETSPDVSHAGSTTLWTIESSVSNLAVSEDISFPGHDSDQDECPPKRQKISPSAMFHHDSGCRINARKQETVSSPSAMPSTSREGQESLPVFSPRPRSLDPENGEDSAPCQYHDCFVLQYRSPSHVHVLEESCRSRPRAKKCVQAQEKIHYPELCDTLKSSTRSLHRTEASSQSSGATASGDFRAAGHTEDLSRELQPGPKDTSSARTMISDCTSADDTIHTASNNRCDEYPRSKLAVGCKRMVVHQATGSQKRASLGTPHAPYKSCDGQRNFRQSRTHSSFTESAAENCNEEQSGVFVKMETDCIPSSSSSHTLTCEKNAEKGFDQVSHQMCSLSSKEFRSDEEKEFRTKLKERLVPGVYGSDSASQSSELEDSDSSILFSSLSGNSYHDDNLLSDHSDCDTPQPVGATTISHLPTVVLIHIFSWLPVATCLGTVNRVCKVWQSAVLDPSLWRYLDLTDLPRLKDSSLLQVTSYSDRIHTLIMTDGKSTLLTDSGVVKVLQQLHHLQRVDISQSFFLSNESFSAFGRFCHRLKRINFDGCFSLADASLQEIGTGCPELEELNISQCSKVSDKGVCAIAAGCPHLTRFRLDQCVKVTDEGVIALTEHCLDLEYLHLLSCSLTDLGVSHLSKLRKLHTLDVSNITHLSPRCLENVALGCPKLESLGVSLNRAIDDQCLRTVAQACPPLKNLSCVACSLTDIGLEHLGKYARNLERLDVAWCGDITEAGITAVAVGCPNLSYLGFMRCSRVNMPVVEDLVYKYPHIKFSNFFLESKRLLAKAQTQGVKIPEALL